MIVYNVILFKRGWGYSIGIRMARAAFKWINYAMHAIWGGRMV